MADWKKIRERAKEVLEKATPSMLNAFLFKERYGYQFNINKYEISFDEEAKAYVVANLASKRKAYFYERILDELAENNDFERIREIIEFQLFMIEDEPDAANVKDYNFPLKDNSEGFYSYDNSLTDYSVVA